MRYPSEISQELRQEGMIGCNRPRRGCVGSSADRILRDKAAGGNLVMDRKGLSIADSLVWPECGGRQRLTGCPADDDRFNNTWASSDMEDAHVCFGRGRVGETFPEDN